MGINDLLPFFSRYGIFGIVILIIITSMLKSKRLGDFITKISDKFINSFKKDPEETTIIQHKSISESDILNHDIFSYIDFWMYSKIPTFQFSTEYRTVVFRKYLVIYLSKYKENINKYIISKEFEEMDDSQLWKSFLSLINNIIYDYEREMEKAGIPIIIIEKMKTKNNDTVSLTIDLIEGICNSHFYDSGKNLLKVYSILNIILSILQNTVSSSNQVCDTINGQLKNLRFVDSNGKIIIEK